MTAISSVTGGNGGDGPLGNGRGGGAAGDAYATSTGGGTATANSFAIGGNAGSAGFGEIAGANADALAESYSTGGQAIAIAVATAGIGVGPGVAKARAVGSGVNGMSSATSTAGGGLFADITARASAPVGSTSVAETFVAWNQPMPEIVTSGEQNSITYVVMQPGSTDVANVIADAPTVASTLSSTSMLVAMQSVLSVDAATPHRFHTSFDVRFDDEQIDLSRLVLGLANPIAIDAGFDELRFAIESAGDMLVDELFDSVETAAAYFADSVFTMDNLGLLPTGEIELSISLEATISTPGAGFQTWLVAGERDSTVPEPASVFLLILGATVVGWNGRRIGSRVTSTH